MPLISKSIGYPGSNGKLFRLSNMLYKFKFELCVKDKMKMKRTQIQEFVAIAVSPVNKKYSPSY